MRRKIKSFLRKKEEKNNEISIAFKTQKLNENIKLPTLANPLMNKLNVKQNLLDNIKHDEFKINEKIYLTNC